MIAMAEIHVSGDGTGDFTSAGIELANLHGALERIRATFAWKCGGLDAMALRTTLGPSTMTLGGLLKHLAYVEDRYFTQMLMGRPLGAPWDAADPEDPDWEWHSAAGDSPAELMALWEAAVRRSRTVVAEALTDSGLGQSVARDDSPDAGPTLRRIIVDLNEEYARHTGHADLIRESIDGLVGEDPPRPE